MTLISMFWVFSHTTYKFLETYALPHPFDGDVDIERHKTANGRWIIILPRQTTCWRIRSSMLIMQEYIIIKIILIINGFVLFGKYILVDLTMRILKLQIHNKIKTYNNNNPWLLKLRILIGNNINVRHSSRNTIYERTTIIIENENLRL